MQTVNSSVIFSWRLRLTTVVGLLILAVTLVGTASAQQGPGPYCAGAFVTPANCTANDVAIASLSPDISEVCLSVDDTVSVAFIAEVAAGAHERYDIGLYVATDGGSALTGTSCYHDFLRPPYPLNDPSQFNANGGPFRNFDGDACADVAQNESVFYQLAVLDIACADNDNDGVVDPISTCTSWDNNSNTTCNNVTQAIPGTPAKCSCQSNTPNPPILIYSGYDFGDLPDDDSVNPGTTGQGDYQTYKADGGPYHAIQKDIDIDGNPDTTGGVPAVWLGPTVDKEDDGQPASDATGDDANDTNPVTPANQDDEDGITPIVGWTAGGTGTVQVVVSSSNNTCTDCNLAYYFDWNDDGDFLDDNEWGSKPVGFGTTNVQFNTPGTLPTSVYSRFRLYTATASLGGYAPTGLVLNGEVEDYKIDLTPLAVTLANFSAICSDGQPEISWETVSELDTLGFNVWRNTSNSGPQDRLNASMIPAHPGSAQGYSYSFTDTTAVAGTTYFYWLEDIDTANVSSFNGPIDIQCQSPTSVGMDTVEANPAAGLPVGALPAAGLLVLGAAGAAAVWLKRRRA